MRAVDGGMAGAVADPGDEQARAHMLLAASFAGIGFGLYTWLLKRHD